MQRSSKLVVTMLLTIGFAGPSLAAEAETPEKTLQNWCEAFQAGAMEEILACYEDSEDVVVIMSSGISRVGTVALRKEYEAAFDEVVFEAVQLEDLRVRTEGNVAWAVARVKADTKRRSDDSLWRLEVRSSFVLKRTDRLWQITLEHSSTIAGVDRVRRRN